MAEPQLEFYFLSDPEILDYPPANAIAAKISSNAILVTSPSDLVMRALKVIKLTGGKIARMRIAGHGAFNQFRIGKTWVMYDHFDTQWKPLFSMLTPCFTKDALVTIQACQCARVGGVDEPLKLLRALSALWGVRVEGWTGDINYTSAGPFSGIDPEGNRIICLSNGVCVPIASAEYGYPPDGRIGPRKSQQYPE